ncbi:MAG: hypothetical protein WC002_00360 [Candidatus Muiribacteriota bacterium]
MDKYIRLLISLCIFTLILTGCGGTRLFSPKSLVLISDVSNAPLNYSEQSQATEISMSVSTANGVGVNFTTYEIEYFYMGNFRITAPGVSKNGPLTKFIPGYSSSSITIRVVTDELLNFVNGNPETSEDNISNVRAKIRIIGVDENENTISAESNIEIFFTNPE